MTEAGNNNGGIVEERLFEVVFMPHVTYKSCYRLFNLQKVVISTCRYFKLSCNTTALSQSNCRNFSCISINDHDKRILQWTLFNINITSYYVKTSGWPCGLRRCVQVAVYSFRRGLESHSCQ